MVVDVRAIDTEMAELSRQITKAEDRGDYLLAALLSVAGAATAAGGNGEAATVPVGW